MIYKNTAPSFEVPSTLALVDVARSDKQEVIEKQNQLEHKIEELTRYLTRQMEKEDGVLKALNTLTETFHQMTSLLSDIHAIEATDVWLYATASNAVMVCNDAKEPDDEYGILEIGERVVLNYPMIQDSLQHNHVWIQVRRLHQNGKIRFRWVRFLVDGMIQFHDLEL
jgi:hypothetical protein